MEAKPRPPEAELDARGEALSLEARFGGLEAEEIIALTLFWFGAGEVASVSSFGADSAVLLHMIARIDPALPVVFLDTGKHFGETLDYRDRLAADLGLTDIRVVTPDEAALARADPRGNLHRSDTDACCAVRKVEPMARGVAPFRAWFTGRKRFQAETRRAMPVFEAVGARIRINPLAHWDTARLAGYMRRHALRENPLVAHGYLSIGCFPCTQVAPPDGDARFGRWAGMAKTECGIHLGGLEAALASNQPS
jgi:phosphoadenosine phosphosulfate reductase